MIDPNMRDEIIKYVSLLPEEAQTRLLDFIRTLVPISPPARGGGELLRFAGAIDPADLRLIETAIVSDCEGIDADEW